MTPYQQQTRQAARQRFWFCIWCMLLFMNGGLLLEMVELHAPFYWRWATSVMTGWALYEVIVRTKRL
jgi:hypothetical protein